MFYLFSKFSNLWFGSNALCILNEFCSYFLMEAKKFQVFSFFKFSKKKSKFFSLRIVDFIPPKLDNFISRRENMLPVYLASPYNATYCCQIKLLEPTMPLYTITVQFGGYLTFLFQML